MLRPMFVVLASLPAMGSGLATPAAAQSRPLMSHVIDDRVSIAHDREPHYLQDNSLFALAEARPRIFRSHDLVQIIVQERSRSTSSQEVETSKESTIDGSISAFPSLNLADIAQLQLLGGSGTNLPRVGIDLERTFGAEGDYTRSDDFSTRITAEVVDVLPNGNLILEARTQVRNDDEVSTIMVTGVCRGLDITAGNTVLSNQIHDLQVDKRNEGPIKQANEKGLITRFFETLFAF
ncbi:MAG: flagellar basal body L-ring protein FlgH [Phycisphaerales bacterium]